MSTTAQRRAITRTIADLLREAMSMLATPRLPTPVPC